MRWFLTMIAVAAGAWYVSNRQRRDRVQHSVRDAVPPGASKRVQRAAATVAEAARQTAGAIQTRVSGPASPAGRAPSGPESGDGPTTGMEQPPVRDHTDALHRTSGAYIGNTKTRIFHRADSDHLPAEEHRVYFASEAEAREAAFEPARNEELETTDP